MKKAKKLLLFAFFLVSCFAFQIQPANAFFFSSKKEWNAGDPWFRKVQSDYEKGKYKSFLKDLDRKYQEKMGKKDSELKEMVKLKNTLLKKKEELKLLQRYGPGIIKKYSRDLTQVFTNTYPKLLETSNLDSTLLVSKIIQSLKITREETLYEDLTETFLSDDPQAAKMREIYIEYAIIKRWLSGIDFRESKLNPNERETLKIVLELEKFKILKNLSKENPSTKVSKYIQKRSKRFYDRASQIHDFNYLLTLGNKLRSPKNKVEEKVGEIMENYIAKKHSLIKKHSLPSLPVSP